MRIQGNGNVGIGFASPYYKLDIGTTSLGTTATNIVPWLRLTGFSNNCDQLNIYHRRYAAGSDWSTAEIRIQKMVDATDMQYISFKGGYNNTIGSLVFGFQNTEQMVIENDGNIGIGTSNPEEAAALDISSTTRGFLPPRMTSSEMNAIPSPPEGLTVYNTTIKSLCWFDGSSWIMGNNKDGQSCGSVSYAGQNYNTVVIGWQCWFKENLNIGTAILSSQNQTDNNVIEKYCYDNDVANCNVYGGLYQWSELMNYTSISNTNPSGRQGICPIGWHVPSDAEFCQMETYLDATVNCGNTGNIGTDVGGKLKEAGTSHWASPNTGATNSSGFTALPGGAWVNDPGYFFNRTLEGIFLTSSGEWYDLIWRHGLYYANAQVSRLTRDDLRAYSARCCKD